LRFVVPKERTNRIKEGLYAMDCDVNDAY